MEEYLELKPRFYPSDSKVAQWAIDAEIVNKSIADGKIPQIVLPGFDKNSNLPVVAVILAKEPTPEKKEDDYCIHPDYVNALQNLNLRLIFISYDKIKEQLETANPKGVLLIGGYFNSCASWYEEPVEEDIDRRGCAYLEILAYAKKHKLPTLGICAGYQMIAGFEGAKLVKGINIGVEADKSHKQPAYQIAHNVHIEPDSQLFKIIGKENIAVNSSHNEAVVGHLLGNCTISARAEDGIVEGIELKNPWNSFVIGIQWHPERLLKLGNENSAKIFNSFAAAIRER